MQQCECIEVGQCFNKCISSVLSSGCTSPHCACACSRAGVPRRVPALHARCPGLTNKQWHCTQYNVHNGPKKKYNVQNELLVLCLQQKINNNTTSKLHRKPLAYNRLHRMQCMLFNNTTTKPELPWPSPQTTAHRTQTIDNNNSNHIVIIFDDWRVLASVQEFLKLSATVHEVGCCPSGHLVLHHIYISPPTHQLPPSLCISDSKHSYKTKKIQQDFLRFDLSEKYRA